MADPKTPNPPTDAVEMERSQFRLLLAQNPNYFGTVANSQLKAVAKIASNTSYEQLTCVGYNLDRSQLEATVHIKRPTGYGGDLCKTGTVEYVRFFLDYGSGWEDQGVTGIKVHDIPTSADCKKDPTKPLSYVASLKIDPRRRVCRVQVLPKVRAILSWQAMPIPGDPNYTPVWGNVLERHIQIQRLWRNFAAAIDQIATTAGLTLELPPQFAQLADIPIPHPDPGDPPIVELAQLYAAKDAKPASAARTLAVESHRFGIADIHTAIQTGTIHQDVLVAKANEWKLAGLDFAAAIAALEKVSANTDYEQLDCLGLDNNTEFLAATFRIKRPAGYSGGPCTSGGYEYVAFWADWDDTCVYTYLGTVKVNVHDFSGIPADGLCYTALLKVNLDDHRRSCKQPKIGRVRAVLSWATPPSTSDPDELKYWGNRIDTHVQINPTGSSTSTSAQIRSIGGIAISDIDPATGLTTPGAMFYINNVHPDALGRPCPFAGLVVITGPTVPGMRYGITVENVSSPSSPQAVVNSFQVLDSSGTTWTTQTASPAHTYAYLNTSLNPDLILAHWASSADDKWLVTLQLYDAAESPVGPPVSRMVQLKNSGIQDARIHIDPLSGGDCHKFFVGDKIDGHFVALDPYLGSWSLGVKPFGLPPGTMTTSMASNTVSTPAAPPGVDLPPPGGATWRLDTTGMRPCGYIVELWVSDRAIINSAWVGHAAGTSVGWCLDPPPKP
jgi:hypothetical protein